MDNLLLLVPLAISVGHCVVSSCIMRRLQNRINFLEERVASVTLPTYPPPPPPPQANYPQPTTYYSVPQGYGYPYSGGQGNLNVI